MECAFTSPVSTECGIIVVWLYMVLYAIVSCFALRGCAVSKSYIDVCNCDMFSGVNVYIDNFKLCVVCMYGRMCVCCCECNVLYNKCNEVTPCHVQLIDLHGGKIMYFRSFAIVVSLIS